ncbi:hypothetical protein ACIGV8_13450 [Streptomyces albidoflavus]
MADQLGLHGSEKQLGLLARELSARGDTAVEPGFRGRRPFLSCLAADLRAFTGLFAHLRRTRPGVPNAFPVASHAARLARVPALVTGRRSLGHFERVRYDEGVLEHKITVIPAGPAPEVFTPALPAR